MYLFQDVAVNEPDQEDTLSFAHLCCINLETALASLPLHLPTNATMIFALVLGVRGCGFVLF